MCAVSWTDRSDASVNSCFANELSTAETANGQKRVAAIDHVKAALLNSFGPQSTDTERNDSASRRHFRGTGM